ncbi:MAG: hypothetical protein ACI81Y_001880 [Glaciecola sp.]|jgi:hypothetical protein
MEDDLVLIINCSTSKYMELHPACKAAAMDPHEPTGVIISAFLIKK